MSEILFLMDRPTAIISGQYSFYSRGIMLNLSELGGSEAYLYNQNREPDNVDIKFCNINLQSAKKCQIEI